MTPPEWSRWSKSNAAGLWEWLALSVNAEPRALSVDHFLVLQSATSAMPLDQPDDPAWLRQMCERLTMLVQQSAKQSDVETATGGEPLAFDTLVSRSDFLIYAENSHWRLPTAWRPAHPQVIDTEHDDPSTVPPETADKAPPELPEPSAAVAAGGYPEGVYPRIVSYILKNSGHQSVSASVNFLKPLLTAHKVKLTAKNLRAALAQVGEDQTVKTDTRQLIDVETWKKVVAVLLKKTKFPVKGRSKALVGLRAELSEHKLIKNAAELRRLLQDCRRQIQLMGSGTVLKIKP